MPFLQRGPAKIYYELHSDGTRTDASWVTLINGHARTSSDFRAMAKYLVENGKSVLLLDNRGCGKTTSPAFTFDEMLGDVVALWDAERISTTHVLGISYGGVISQKLAARHPDRVRSLVLVSTTAESRYLDSGRRLAELPLAEREQELGRYFGSDFAANNQILFRSLTKQMAKAFDDAGFLAKAREQRAALNHFDFRSVISTIQCPCLILHGTDDQVISVQSAHDLHAHISTSELQLFDGVGHLFLAETPRRFYELALKFFNSHDR